MGWFSDDSDQAQAYDQYQNHPHKASLSHELIAAAASYEAAKAYENHVAKNGKPPSHAMAKELFAGFAGGFLEKEIEEKGHDFLIGHKEKLQNQAYDHADEYISNDY